MVLRTPFTLGSRIIAAGVIAGGLVLGTAAARAQDFTMKIAIVVVNDPLHEFIKEYKTRIEAKTNNRIKAELYPGAQLGGIPRLAEGVLLGTIEMFVTPPSFFKGADTRFQVTDGPGLFDNLDHAHAALTDPTFRDPYLDVGVPKGVKGVSMWVYGPTAYASLEPIRKIDDFKGKKLRVLATNVETGIMRKLGAAGVPMDFAEVLGALQNKTLDGIRSSMVVMGASKFFTVTKNLLIVNDTMIPCAAMVSTAFLNKLPADLRQAVLDVGKDMEPFMLKTAKEFDARAEQLWKDNGATISRLTDAERADFLKRAVSVGDEVLGSDAQLKPLYEALKKAAETHRKRS
ncbi:MAG: TRAP transporter substrate-binding protein [Alphaproteobacteria bacterium]|nr:TRAP transporter substrate-binding protein [Alphaproteobacteria bacterium]